MVEARKEAKVGGRLLMLGYGSVGQGVLPLLLRHLDVQPRQIRVLTPSERGTKGLREMGIERIAAKLDRENHRHVLEPLIDAGDVVLNLSVDVCSQALIALCQERRALYVDACTEPWPGGYTERTRPPAHRTNYRLREGVLSLRRPGEPQPTALITLGANPGLVSFLAKRALHVLSGVDAAPRTREGWAELARRLGVRTIHVAERDDQVSAQRKRPGEFVNTWSVDGFMSEGLQPAELGWGTHERHFPADGGTHDTGSRAAIYLRRPGASTRVRTWTPLAGPIHGFLVTHAESISIADHLTLGDPARPDYRPTVHYAYHPSDDAVLSLHELAGREWLPQERKRIVRDDIVSGRDELGVLLMGERGSFWYGSQLSIEQARGLAPSNSATSLQVTAPLMAGVAWALRNPEQGILEPDDLPHDEMLRMITPYLGDVVGVHDGWTPLDDRERHFDEPVDRDDPWQFVNFRVT